MKRRSSWSALFRIAKQLGESVIGIGIPFKGKPGHKLFHAEFTRLT
jgi:hypothetical protein